MTPPRKTIPINGCTKRSIIPTSNRQSVATLRASGFRSGSDVCLDVDNYIDQMITFSITLGHGSNNFDDSNGNDGNGLSAFDQLLDIISAVFV